MERCEKHLELIQTVLDTRLATSGQLRESLQMMSLPACIDFRFLSSKDRMKAFTARSGSPNASSR